MNFSHGLDLQKLKNVRYIFFRTGKIPNLPNLIKVEILEIDQKFREIVEIDAIFDHTGKN